MKVFITNKKTLKTTAYNSADAAARALVGCILSDYQIIKSIRDKDGFMENREVRSFAKDVIELELDIVRG